MVNIFIEKIGYSVCHKLPQRTLTFGNIYLPVCSRCSGIYIGFLISAIILFIMFRKKESNLPPPYILVILIIFIFSTIVDGALSYTGILITNNIIRFITGFLCGSSFASIIYPVFVYQYYQKPKEIKIFNNLIKFIIYLLILLSFITLTLSRIELLGFFFYYLSAFSIIFTFYFINLIIILLIPPFSQKAKKFISKYLILPSIISLFLSSVEFLLSYRLSHFLSGFKI